MGNYTRSGSELCLLGIKGNPKRASASVHSTLLSPIERHSKKPDDTIQRINLLCGDCNKIELFARSKNEGWDSLGYGVDNRDIRESLKLLI